MRSAINNLATQLISTDQLILGKHTHGCYRCSRFVDRFVNVQCRALVCLDYYQKEEILLFETGSSASNDSQGRDGGNGQPTA